MAAAKKGPKLPIPAGCLPRYLTMSYWKSKQIAKKSRGSRTGSSKARITVAYPPEGGWPGGVPSLATGFKRSGK
jgi:hypothetical protein